MDEGDFLRQRRNVFVISLIIIAYNVAGGDISDFKFYGMELHNEWALIVGVWIGFSYALYRFWMFSDMPGQVGDQSYHDAFATRFGAYAASKPLMFEQLEHVFRDDYVDLKRQYHEINRHQEDADFSVKTVVAARTQRILPKEFNYRYLNRGAQAKQKIRTDLAIVSFVTYVWGFAAKDTIASDLLLPYFIAFLAVVSGVVALFV